MAEEVGFEPTVPLSTTVFKTAAFNHSATPPNSYTALLINVLQLSILFISLLIFISGDQ